MLLRLFLCALLLSSPAWLFAQSQVPETLPAEAVGNALTKRMQGELELRQEQIASVREINNEYAEAVSRLRRNPETTGVVTLQELISNWETAVGEVIDFSQQRVYRRVRTEYLTELQLAGLQRSTARLALKLDLDTEQIAGVEALETEYFPQMAEVQTGGDPPRIKMRRLRGLQQEKAEKLEQILTATQFEAYLELVRNQSIDY